MKQYIYLLLSVGLAILVIGCGTSEKKGPSRDNTDNAIVTKVVKVSKVQFEGSKMQLGTLIEQSFPIFVKATGMIDVPPENKAVINAFVGGYIKKTPLLVGNRVKKGDALVTLENPEFVDMQQEYLEASEQLIFLKSEYERQKTLIKEKITSQKNFLKAESEYKRTLAMCNGLRKKLQMLNIDPKALENGNITSVITLYAPIDGSITNVYVSKGSYISPSDEIMEIVNTDHVHLELSVFEKDIMKIKKEQPIIFTIPEVSKDSYRGEVHLVGTAIDPKTRTIKVHGHLNHEDHTNYAIGMFVEANIATINTMEWALPIEAVVSIEDKQYVLLLISQENGEYSFEQKEVKTGSIFNGLIVIENARDFKESNQILYKGAFNIIEGE